MKLWLFYVSNVPAVLIHLKQLFWSILDQMTYLAFGRSFLNASMTKAIVIPVAIGTTNASLQERTPSWL